MKVLRQKDGERGRHKRIERGKRKDRERQQGEGYTVILITDIWVRD